MSVGFSQLSMYILLVPYLEQLLHPVWHVPVGLVYIIIKYGNDMENLWLLDFLYFHNHLQPTDSAVILLASYVTAKNQFSACCS